MHDTDTHERIHERTQAKLYMFWAVFAFCLGLVLLDNNICFLGCFVASCFLWCPTLSLSLCSCALCRPLFCPHLSIYARAVRVVLIL